MNVYDIHRTIIYTYIYIYVDTSATIHVFTHTHACLHACMHACMHACLHTYTAHIPYTHIAYIHTTYVHSNVAYITYIHTQIDSYIHTYITLHYITLHCITLHYITLHYITLHYITLHYITLHYITLHYITLHYITYIHKCIHAFMHACVCMCMSMYLCVYTYIHMHIDCVTYMSAQKVNTKAASFSVSHPLLPFRHQEMMQPGRHDRMPETWLCTAWTAPRSMNEFDVFSVPASCQQKYRVHYANNCSSRETDSHNPDAGRESC